MHEGDRLAPSPTADATRFDRAVTHVTRREHARHGGLQIVRITVELPGLSQRAELRQVGSGPTSFAHWVFGTPPRQRNRKLVSIVRS
jgi:hypothetical protein